MADSLAGWVPALVAGSPKTYRGRLQLNWY